MSYFFRPGSGLNTESLAELTRLDQMLGQVSSGLDTLSSEYVPAAMRREYRQGKRWKREIGGITTFVTALRIMEHSRIDGCNSCTTITC